MNSTKCISMYAMALFASVAGNALAAGLVPAKHSLGSPDLQRGAPFSLIWNRLTSKETVELLEKEHYLRSKHPKVPKHLRASGVLDWLNFDGPRAAGLLGYDAATKQIAGSFLSGSPVDVYAQLQQAFSGDKFRFLKKHFTVARIAQLTRQTAATPAPKGPANYSIFYWNYLQLPTTPYGRKMWQMWRDEATGILSPTPAELASKLNALPPGQRFVIPANFQLLPGGLYWDHEVQDQALNGPSPKSISSAAWRAKIGPLWDDYWRQVKQAGGKVDAIVFDLEQSSKVAMWNLKPSDMGAIFNRKSRAFLDFERSLGFSVDSLATLTDVQSHWWQEPRDPRSAMWNQAVQNRTGEDENYMFSFVQKHFPKVQGLDYDHTLCAPSTYPANWYPAAYLGIYGTGSYVGTGSSVSLYGYLRPVWDWSQHKEIIGNGITYKQGDPAPTVAFPPDNATTWAAFTYNLMGLRSAAAASTIPLNAWIAFKSYNDPASPTVQGYPTPAAGSSLLYKSDLWYELSFHSALTGAQLFYYSEGATDDDTPMVNAMSEINEALRAPGLQPIVDEPIAWNLPYIATRADVGGRIIWRVTPQPGVVATTKYQGANLVFSFSGSNATLSIPNGKVSPVKKPASLAGYWVVQ